jgi:C_GCAxxG_C_C family probable redox protein
MNREQAVALARQTFARELNCAESVLLTMARYWGLRPACIPQIASPFGAGMGRCGLTCGAVTGALMAIGLKMGRRTPEKDNRACYGAARKFMSKFEKRFGDTACYGLTGVEVWTAAGRREWKKQGMRQTCSQYVEWAVGELCRTLPKK